MRSLKILFKTALLLMLFCTFSCKKYLNDNINKATVNDATQWSSEGNADIFLNAIYGQLSNSGNYPDNLDNFTDDNDGGYYWRSYHWKAGSVGPSVDGGQPMSDYSGSNQTNAADFSAWNPVIANTQTGCYTKVRRCNLFLQKIAQYKSNFSAAWMAKRTDEVRFLRAFFYSQLFQHVGGLVLLTSVEDNSTETAAQLNVPRSSFEATFNFLDSELDAIVKDNVLAVKYPHGDANAGRATLGAALMLKGWIELFAASPEYNSGSSPTGVADPNNLIHFASADPTRWAKAAATFQQFMTTYTQYSLFPQLDQLWYEANEYNSEIIFDKNLVAGIIGNEGSNYEQYGGPVYILGTYYTWGNYDPTQELVDAFRMANGKDISDPTSGYDPQHPYVGREQRFYQFIVYDGAPYSQPWMPKTDTIYTRIDKLHPSLNQIDFAQSDVSNTGYYSRKRLNPLAPPGGSFASGQNYVYFRYVEVLLGYAEAQNEAVGPDASVYAAMLKIRQRSNLPALPAGLTQAAMRTQIHNERRIELCYENKRIFDILRWQTASALLNVDRHGMQITNTSPNDDKGTWTYTPVLLNHPHVFTQNMYVNPIPQAVIDQNPSVLQNPGY
jgi:hypothetical protein